MVKKLFDYVIQNGNVSDKKSEIDFFSKKDKVYTKKIEIPGDSIIIDGCEVKFISVTSNSGNFDDVLPNDVRVNMKNPFGMWVNVHATSLSEQHLKQILKKINIE